MSVFIEEHRERFGVEPICSTLGVSASAHYERVSGRRSARAIEDERLLAKIRQLHERNYLAYGSRRMWKVLLRAGGRVGRSRVERLMRNAGIQGASRRGKPWRTTRSDPSAHRAPDLVQRDFQACRPDKKWFADFTYLRCWEGLVFFSFVIDAYSRRIVLDALRMALHQRAPGADVTLVHHGDAGSQYTSFDYTADPARPRRARLDRNGRRRLRQRARRELRRLLQDRAHRQTASGTRWRARAGSGSPEYVAWFNNERLHEALEDQPPREREEEYAAQQAAATSGR